MIYRKMTGRCGNQLFQYASALGIIANGNKKNLDGVTIKCDFTPVYKKDFNNDLKEFNLKHYSEVNKVELTMMQRVILVISKFIEKVISLISNEKNNAQRLYGVQVKLQKILNKFNMVKIEQGYVKTNIKVKENSNYYISGKLESAQYFDDIRLDILEEFTPKKPKIESNKDLYNIIENSNSVCISIRRGDFLSNEFNNEHNVCNADYFKNAVKLIKEKVENPKFIIFSDDIEWCKHNLDFIEEKFYESGNDPIYEKLRLMYSCKHFIISNSTFSWWAQYLSRNTNKIVIAPYPWKNYGYFSDIYQDNFIQLDVKNEFKIKIGEENKNES